ncbi:hypothetical protein I6I64_05900 [Corynebacterium amycolatum]|uniref:hypothetical protein n=1 Tax=Corynebacterium amycolatum TaxID=43765 RepID=UPI0015C34E03|nr:hypothetical protein [Corynebacterium amycolatum]MCQ9128531.1 hypothetical protein [Corynebacterium amycolatum]MCQ9141022.1 hypothetical protein [Corynebacterium amycolatum]MCQ9171755.1 hypothetical protein [Corynebacterium amycolatum]QQV01161.1 hypothetical protein I6I64_05900 [Corynebacterium amycolatum]
MKVYSWGNLLLSELVGGGPKTGSGVFGPHIEKHFLWLGFLEGEYERAQQASNHPKDA